MSIRDEALQRLHQRIQAFMEHDRNDYLDDRDNIDWTAVIHQEVAFLVCEGPAAYLRYVAALDDAAVRADLDRHLKLILGEG